MSLIEEHKKPTTYTKNDLDQNFFDTLMVHVILKECLEKIQLADKKKNSKIHSMQKINTRCLGFGLSFCPMCRQAEKNLERLCRLV